MSAAHHVTPFGDNTLLPTQNHRLLVLLGISAVIQWVLVDALEFVMEALVRQIGSRPEYALTPLVPLRE
jgi:hypothetical protein